MRQRQTEGAREGEKGREREKKYAGERESE